MPISYAPTCPSDVQNEALPRAFTRERLTNHPRKTEPDPAAFYDAVQAFAGENTDQIIRVFNSSLHEFFCLTKVTRGALGLSLTTDVIINAGDFIYKKDKEILKQVLHQDWTGSAKILQKLPAIMLSPEQYKKLRTLLGCITAKKYLQHASIINGDTIDVLYALPEQLRVQPVMKHIRQPVEAELIAALCASLTDVDGLIQKAKNAKTRSTFWDKVVPI